MRLMDPISPSLTGMYNASARYDRASRRLISAVSTGQGDAVAAVVDQKQAEIAFAASASTYRTISRTQQRLLDIMV